MTGEGRSPALRRQSGLLRLGLLLLALGPREAQGWLPFSGGAPLEASSACWKPDGSVSLLQREMPPSHRAELLTEQQPVSILRLWTCDVKLLRHRVAEAVGLFVLERIDKEAFASVSGLPLPFVVMVTTIVVLLGCLLLFMLCFGVVGGPSSQALLGGVLPNSESQPTDFGDTPEEVVKRLVQKHVKEGPLVELAEAEHCAVTSTERGVLRYEHSHLVVALDVLLMYQRDRRAVAPGALASMRRPYTNDPRTRVVELLKSWLRKNCAVTTIPEEELRRMCSLCRDLLGQAKHFPGRNSLSFMQAIAQVHGYLQLQLREVLERERTCANLATLALSLSRNLVSDLVAFLLTAPTELRQTDRLPSLEVVTLWRALPGPLLDLMPEDLRNPDLALQDAMRDAWLTQCGHLVAGLLVKPCTYRLFHADDARRSGESGAELSASLTLDAWKPGPAGADDMMGLIRKVRHDFERGALRGSGLAGPFRAMDKPKTRLDYVVAVELLFQLIFLLGEVLTRFHVIGNWLGDYGMIRAAPWLHPCLDALVDKLAQLRKCLDAINESVDEELVLAAAKGRSVVRPVPSERMVQRAHAAADRAMSSKDNHMLLLQRALEDLRSRSGIERLPAVVAGPQEALVHLRDVLKSQQFKDCVGEIYNEMPPFGDVAEESKVGAVLGLVDPLASEDEHEEATTGGLMPSKVASPRLTLDTEQQKLIQRRPVAKTRSLGPRKEMTKTLSVAPFQHTDSLRSHSASPTASSALSFQRLASPLWANVAAKREGQGEARAAALGQAAAPGDLPPGVLLDSGLEPSGWVCRRSEGGGASWHHRSFGPAPWEEQKAAADAPVAEADQEEDAPFQAYHGSTEGGGATEAAATAMKDHAHIGTNLRELPMVEEVPELPSAAPSPVLEGALDEGVAAAVVVPEEDVAISVVAASEAAEALPPETNAGSDRASGIPGVDILEDEGMGDLYSL